MIEEGDMRQQRRLFVLAEVGPEESELTQRVTLMMSAKRCHRSQSLSP